MNSADSNFAYPYPGLRPFKQEGAALFFGRGCQINEMLMRFEAQQDFRFLAVLGASGSGKSSLVRAGLLPALSQGFLLNAPTTLDDPANWKFVTARPGGEPLRNLANAWCDTFHAQISQSDEDKMERYNFALAQLRAGPLGLVRAYRGEKEAQGCAVLILIDQFEELFRFAGREQPGLSTAKSNQAKLLDGSNSTTEQPLIAEQQRNEAAAFVELLLITARQTDVPIYIVITMRSDFLGHCDAFLGLPEAISRSQYLTPRMTRPQLAEAIRRPLELPQFSASIDEALINQILNDVGTDPDQLPLMQHVLMRTWCEALKRKKEEILNSLESDQERRIAQQLFICLSDDSSDRPLTRRIVKLAEVAAVADVETNAVIKVVRVFQQEGNNFIMASPQGELTAESELDINEEALLHVGQKLVLEDYKNAKKLSGALSEHLNEVLNSLNNERERRIAQQLFICLSDDSSDRPLTRRIVKLAEVAAVEDVETDAVIKVVRVFQQEGNNFIMASPAGELSAESELDISHESLLRQWGEAQNWLAQEAEAARQYRRLIDKVQQNVKRLSEIELVQALDWSKTPRTPTWAMRYDNAQTPAESKLPACLELIKYSKLEDEFESKFRIVRFIFFVLFLVLFLNDPFEINQKKTTEEYSMSADTQRTLRGKNIVVLPRNNFKDIKAFIETEALKNGLNLSSIERKLPKEIFPLLTKGNSSKIDESHLEHALKTKFIKLPDAIILKKSKTFEQKTGVGVSSESELEQLSTKFREDMKQKGIDFLPEPIFFVKKEYLNNASTPLKEMLEKNGIVIVSNGYSEPTTEYDIVELNALPEKIDVAKPRSDQIELYGMSALDFPIFSGYLLENPHILENLHEGFYALSHVVLGLFLLFIVRVVWRWLVFKVFQSQRGIINFSAALLLFGLILLSAGLFSFVQADREEASMLIFGVPVGILLILLSPVHVLLEEPWANRFKEVQGFLLKLYGCYALTGSLFLFITTSQIEYSWEPGLLLVRKPMVLLIGAFALFILGQRKCALARESLVLPSDQGYNHELSSRPRLYSDRAISLTSFYLFGFGLPAGVMIFRNLWCMGRKQAASIGLVIPFIPFIVAVGYSMILLLNERAFDFEVVPLSIMALLSSPYITDWLWRRLSGREIRQHFDHKGALQPFWKVLLVLVLAAPLGMFGWTYLLGVLVSKLW